METEHLRAALETAGLSQYQAAAYIAVLELGKASAVEIAEACSVPQARIYDVLRDLEAAGYIETYEQDSLHARAHDPGEVLANLREQAATFETAADEIEERWERPPVDDHMVSIVKRFDTVLDRARDLVADADNEVQLSVSPEQFRALRPQLERARENDAVVKVSIHTTDPATVPDRDAFADAVSEVRHRKLPSPFLAIVDRTKACFAPHDRSVNQYGVLVDDYTLTYVFHWFFLTSLWEVWDVVYSSRSTEPPFEYTNIRECVRELNSLLADGATVRATVRGYRTGGGDPCEISGTITEATYAGVSTDSEEGIPLAQLAGKVTVHLSGDDGTEYTVGGWGAFVEDVEATRITVESVETPE
ncbi:MULTISPECIES: TrmB family transcriptional regulator [Halorussus]|uniref:TrmB family transcriptional regulator n=1 Tax=Halorussus TaxID=1070314 RepID=UPI00209E3E6E|nr:TrmB family transcriptional regulator [Halorussus vallis]USZ77850.1 TrmB family transcriptional regulator [Halorussus vallis]